MHPCRSSDEFPACLPFASLRAPKVYFLIYFNVYLFLAVLGASSLMHTQGFSSYRVGATVSFQREGFSVQRLLLLQSSGS